MRLKILWMTVIVVIAIISSTIYLIFQSDTPLKEASNEITSRANRPAPKSNTASELARNSQARRPTIQKQTRSRISNRAKSPKSLQKPSIDAAEDPATIGSENIIRQDGPAAKTSITKEFRIGTQNADKPYTVVQVYYATDRKKNESTVPGKVYGVNRSDLTYGICEVSIPKDHRLGELEAPSIWKLEFQEDPEKHVVLLKVEEKNKDLYFEEVSKRVSASASKSAFLFVHGFNVTFEHAARRTAQMAYDLKYDGAPVFYSWPSQGSSSAYTVDENNVEWTEKHLEVFLTEFVTKSDAKKIYLVAHSMGSRALTKAVMRVADEVPSIKEKIEAIILAAPDIDADIFRDRILPKIKPVTKNLTLYASSRDKALIASKQVHGYSRAGEVGPGIVVAEGLDTIDATSVDTSFIGHSYYAEAKSIVADLFEILKYQRTAKERLNLALTNTPSGDLWVFKAAAKLLQKEPPGGSLGPGDVRYIDDGSCGKDRIKKSWRRTLPILLRALNPVFPINTKPPYKEQFFCPNIWDPRSDLNLCICRAILPGSNVNLSPTLRQQINKLKPAHIYLALSRGSQRRTRVFIYSRQHLIYCSDSYLTGRRENTYD